jgi:hypothetical protein
MERPQILNKFGWLPMDAQPIPQTKRYFRFESSGERAGKLRLYHRQQCGFQGDAGPVFIRHGPLSMLGCDGHRNTPSVYGND